MNKPQYFGFSKDKKQQYYAVDFNTIMGRKVEIFDTLEEANIFLDRVATITRNNSNPNIALVLEVEKIQQGENIYYLERKIIKIM